MKFQISATTHLATGRDQKVSGHNQPPPSPDRVKVALRLLDFQAHLTTYSLVEHGDSKISGHGTLVYYCH